MHDLIAAQDILKTAVNTAALRDLKQITSVTVRLGTLVQHGQAITPQNLKFNFNLVRKNTVAAIETPRGILLHYYETDRLGILKNVNIITPTAQMINNLEVDLEHYLRAARRHAPDARKLGTLIRAYDPCMTCATH
ncbi:MAG: hypothetical protein PHF98_00660 [Patescibacteria group bacterium]|nr:hypothetical protein [Patescibacteria group bacterium]